MTATPAAGENGAGSSPSEAVAQTTEAVSRTAETVARHPLIRDGARLGYVVSGVLHVLMGVLAIRLAAGDRGSEPDQSGALQALAGTPFGWVLLALSAVGLGLLAAWQIAQVLRRRPVGGRGKAAAKAIVYLVLVAGAVGFLIGPGSSSVAQTRDVTAWIMGLPFGPVLVGLIGFAVVGVGAYHVVKGVRRGFLTDLAAHPARPVRAAAMIGHAVEPGGVIDQRALAFAQHGGVGGVP